MTKLRNYTVTSNQVSTNAKLNESFKNLKEARQRGWKHYRAGTFIRLTNINGVLLNLM